MLTLWSPFADNRVVVSWLLGSCSLALGFETNPALSVPIAIDTTAVVNLVRSPFVLYNVIEHTRKQTHGRSFVVAGEHKRKIIICVALDGLRLRDENSRVSGQRFGPHFSGIVYK